MIDPARVRTLAPSPARPDGDYVLYWMTAARRTRFNPALEHAVGLAAAADRPLVVLDALQADHPHASARTCTFAVEGMEAVRARFAAAGVRHHPYVEPAPGAGRGLLAALARRAVAVVADDVPGDFRARLLAAAARTSAVRLDAVDGAGLYPVRAAGRPFHRAFDLRRHLAVALRPHLARAPVAEPLDLVPFPRDPALPAEVLERWPARTALPQGVDAGVPALPGRGGEARAAARLARFLDHVEAYAEDRRHPDLDGTSALSPWLHWGHLSVHDVLAALAHRYRVDPAVVGLEGFPEAVRGFLDELVTWRELALNGAAFLPAHDRYEGLPGWVRATLDAHRADPRPYRYDRDTLEAGRTHDAVWNAAQGQLVAEGWMHNQLRMVWGKKVLEWSATPEEAFHTLLHLNDRWALDGRDANSVAGIAWVFGRYDRPWGPERPVYGLVRYMSTASSARKLQLDATVRRYGGAASTLPLHQAASS